MNLRSLQRAFCTFLAGRQTDLNEEIPVRSEKGLGVYHYAYRAQLIAYLRDTYKKSWAWLGDEAFDNAARAYVHDNLSENWTLGAFGEGFNLTLAELHPDDPEVGELAWLEWALRRAFDGPDADRAPIAESAELDWELAQFRFVPTLRVKSVQTNCAAIWTAIAHGETPPAAEHLPVIAGLRVWRQDLTPRFRKIDAVERHALGLARAGGTFGEICAALSRDREQDEAMRLAGEMLVAWSSDGLIAAIEAPPAAITEVRRG